MKIPDHDLLRQIGKGSYGEVWLARNVMGTFRAVKVVYRKTFENNVPYERELAGIEKFEPISRSHEGLIDILQIGKNSDDTCFFYVMEVADDMASGQQIDPAAYIPKTLGKELHSAKRFSVERCIKIGMSLCETLDFLHKKGLVHRDIKPANIVFVNDAPKLADVGLVAASREAKSIVGTEGFIPPEGPGSEQADIYSLGKVLYEMATGRDREDFPVLPTKFGESSDADGFLELNEVIVKACRNNVADRYQSAAAMYGELALLASGKSLRRLRMAEQRLHRLQRTLAVAGVVVAALFLAGLPFYQGWKHAAENRERQIGIRSANGSHLIDGGDFLGALSEFSEVGRLEAKVERRVMNQMRVGSILADAPKLIQMHFLDSAVRHVNFARDGKSLLVNSKNHGIRIHDTATGDLTVPAFGPDILEQASWSPDNRLIAASGRDGVSVWDSVSGVEMFQLSHTNRVLCARFSPDGARILTGGKDGIARMWDVQTHKLLFSMAAHHSGVKSVEFSPDGRYCCTTSYDASARIWDASSGTCLSAPMRHPGVKWVVSCAFSPDSRTVATGGHDGWAKLWKVPSGEEITSVMRHDNGISAVRYSPDGTMIATASLDGTVMLWDASTSMAVERNHVLPHSASVFALSFSPGGEQIVTGCSDGTVRIWDLTSAGIEMESFEGTVNSTGLASTRILGNRLVTSQFGGIEEQNTIDVPSGIVELSLSDDGSTLASSVGPSSRGNWLVQVWHTKTSKALFKLELTTNIISRVTLSSDGSQLGFLDDKRLRVFSIETQREANLPESLVAASDFVFARRSHQIAVASGNLYGLVDLVTGCAIQPTNVLRAGIKKLTLSPDENRLVACLANDNINPEPAEIIDAKTGALTGLSLWHRDGVMDAAFRRDGKILATGGEDRTVNLWDVQSGRQINSIFSHHAQVIGVAFDPHGKLLGSISANQHMQIWDPESGSPVTPPQRISAQRIIFLPQDQRVSIIQDGKHFSILTIPSDTRSPDEIASLSRLLTSQVSGDHETVPVHLQRLWKSLSAKYPGDFSVSKEHLRRWHEASADSAEREQKWSRAVFHLAWLLGSEPENQGIARRLETAHESEQSARQNGK